MDEMNFEGCDECNFDTNSLSQNNNNTIKIQENKDNMVELFSTGCPKCNILEKKLSMKNIEFVKNDNIDEVVKAGYSSAPILKVDGKYLEFTDAIKWVNEV